MNSPELHKYDEFDATIGRELQSWAAQQHPPPGIRDAVMQGATRRTRTRDHRARRAPMLVRKLQRRLIPPKAHNQLNLPYDELSKWLFSQAMWQNLGNDRRAVRFVC